MSLAVAFHDGFYTGTAAQTSLVPDLYDVALGGHPYLIDKGMDGDVMHFADRFHHETIPVLRAQTQTQGKLGEASINPSGLWRSSVETWHKGAGQANYDLADSDPARFRTSKGVDPWEKWELSLLQATDQKLASVEENLLLLPVGDYLYAVDGTDLKFTTDVTAGGPTWTTVVGTPGTTIYSATTDGYTVYLSDGIDIYTTVRGSATMTAWSAYDTETLGYVKGRLMGSHNNVCSNITGSAAKTDVVTHPNLDFQWVSFAEGHNCLYMAGFSGDKSYIYRTSVTADGTALDAGVVAGEIPDGEIIRCIYGYLGFVLIGTETGVRFATADSNGDLTIGKLINIGGPVLCFEGQDRFVWFGWTDFDSASTGLGRLDLSILNDTQPAYASDLMVDAQGEVQGVVSFQDIRVFTVSGSGVWAQDTPLVEEGTVESGVISFGIPEAKVAMLFDLRHRPLAGTVTVGLALDDADNIPVGSAVDAGTTGVRLSIGEKVAERFEQRLTLTADGDEGPTVTRTVLQMNPTTDTGFLIVVPIMLSTVDLVKGQDRSRDVDAELSYIEQLRSSRDVVLYQEASRSYAVSVEDFVWSPTHPSPDGLRWEGTCVLNLKVVA